MVGATQTQFDILTSFGLGSFVIRHSELARSSHSNEQATSQSRAQETTMVVGGARYPIAIDVGEDSVRAVQIRRADSTLRVNALARVDFEASDEEDACDQRASALEQVCRTPGLNGKAICLHLPPESVFSFPVTFEAQPSETIEAALLREAQHSFPHPLEELVIDYASLDAVSGASDEGQFRATVIGVHRPVLETWLAAARTAGLCVEAVDYSVSSLRRLHTHYHPSPSNPAVLCHIGRRHSLICVVTADSILAHRNVRWGIDDIGDRLRQNLELPAERRHADFLLREHGLSYTPEEAGPDRGDEDPERAVRRAVYQLASPIVDGWTSDFHTLTGYVMSEVQRVEFSGLYLYGNAALVQDLAPYMQARTKIPTQTVSPMVRFRDVPPSAGPSPADLSTYSLALGLAMRRVSWL
jgi:type IV pilus assembly protein PilM